MHGICYKPSVKIDFRGYSDADWSGDLTDHKSTSGYVFILLGAPVSWCSKKQPSVSLSTSEAEYIALESGDSRRQVDPLLTVQDHGGC
uniref:Uncharacterized protein n=1 Tax=Peronospora matthiolae TaxID=2874970 RepID=A0AAV1THT1_9STRA